MSDEEEYSEEEVDEEVEESEAAEPVAAEPAPAEASEEAPAEEEEEEEEADEPTEEKTAAAAPAQQAEVEGAPKLRKVERQQPREADGEGQPLTEAEQAMLDAKKRHEEEEAKRLESYEESRKLEKIKVDEELAALKQRQTERRKEWEQEERQYAEQRKADEDRKRAEQEARKAKIEEAKAKREEEKQRRQLLMTGAFVGGGTAAALPSGRNFVIQKKEGGQSVGPAEGGRKGVKTKTAEEIASEKSNYMSIVNRPVDVANLLPNDLKAKIKQLHAKIVRLESEKYDLQKRHERQDYDLKELAERESQRARNKALAMGVEVEQAEGGLVRPPKVNVASKFDRQVDRRSFGQKYDQFEKPYVKPNPSIARGTARPPPEWGRKVNDELDQLRKNLEPPKYVEQVKIEGARAPVQPIPLQLPASDFEGEADVAAPVKEEAPAPPEKPKRAWHV